MAFAHDRRLRRSQRLGGVVGETDKKAELFIARAKARCGIADGEDPEQLVAGPVERDENLVIGVPGLRVVTHDALGDVAVADVVLPVELAVLDEEGAASEEAIVEQLRPLVPAVGAAEERALNLLVAVDGGDAEVVPLTAVEVEDDGLEAEHVCDRACDQREDGRQIAFGPYELGDSDQGADARELARIPSPCAPKQAFKARMPRPTSRSSDLLAADGTVLSPNPE